MSWPTIAIGEFCETGSGTTPPRDRASAYYGGGIPWVKSGELRDNIIFDTAETVTEAALNETPLRIAPTGALLVAMYGATVGRVAQLGIPATTNQAVCHIVPDRRRADSRFLFHALRTKLPEFINGRVGGAQPNISQQYIRGTKVILPPLEEQRRIAAILDAADDLRAKRRAALVKLDQVAQSIFIDMFGDPAVNPQHSQCKRLVEVCASADDIKCGPFGTQLAKSEYTREGVPLWGIKQVNAKFRRDTPEFISLEKAQELSPYSLTSGDIVMTRKGTVGNCAVYPPEFPMGIMHSDLLRIRVDRSICDPVFLSHQLHYSRDVERQMTTLAGGAVMPGINVSRLKDITILLPPIQAQRQFSIAVENLESLRAKCEVGKNKLEQLFHSLQARAFGGEL